MAVGVLPCGGRVSGGGGSGGGGRGHGHPDGARHVVGRRDAEAGAATGDATGGGGPSARPWSTPATPMTRVVVTASSARGRWGTPGTCMSRGSTWGAHHLRCTCNKSDHADAPRGDAIASLARFDQPPLPMGAAAAVWRTPKAMPPMRHAV